MIGKKPRAKAMAKSDQKLTEKVEDEKSLATAANSKGLSTELADFDSGESTPQGLENVTARDLIIPRLTILQGLSPELQPRNKKYIKGATVGQFCDTAVGQVFAGDLIVLPVLYARIFLEWAPRSTGQGLVANHGTNGAILEKCRPDKERPMVMVMPNGNYIAETATYFCLNMSAGGRRSFIPLASTQLGSSRRWMMKITSEKLKRADGTEFTPSLFYRSWVASVAEDHRPKGDFFGWSFEPGKSNLEIDPSRKLLTESREFYKQASEGLVQGDYNKIIEENAEAENATEGAM